MATHTTIVTSSLEPTHLAKIGMDLGRVRVVVSDIDYTLIDMGGARDHAMRALIPFVGEDIARDVSAIVHSILQGNRHCDDVVWDQRQEYEDLMHLFDRFQHNIIPRWGRRQWSRETMILIAAYRAGRSIAPKEVERACAAYWSAFRNCSAYDDAKDFVAYLRARTIPLILMTASDCVLRCTDAGVFEYDPEYSMKYKMVRLNDLPFAYDGIVIGDPDDKPSDKYFDAIETFLETHHLAHAKDHILFVGDSDKNDLEIPRKRGYPTLLISR